MHYALAIATTVNSCIGPTTKEKQPTPVTDGQWWTMQFYYVRKQLLLSVHLSHRNSVCPSVTRVDQSKMVQARITKSSPSAAWKTLVSGTVKLFHKLETGHLEQVC